MHQAATGHYEPSLTHQLLRGCPNCREPHPIVQRAADTSKCPQCGTPSIDPDAPITDKAVLTGARVRFGLWLIRIGEWLDRLSQKKRD